MKANMRREEFFGNIKYREATKLRDVDTDAPVVSKRALRNRERIEMKKKNRRTVKEVAEILCKHGGHIQKAAEEMGVNSTSLRRHVNANPFLRDVVRELDEEFVDDAKLALREQVRLGNVTATTFVLKTLGKHRGFSEKNTLEHQLGGSAQNAAGLISAMRKGAAASLEDKSEVVDVGDYKVEEATASTGD